MFDPVLLKNSVKTNSQVLEIISSSQLIEAWQQNTGKEIAQIIGQVARDASDYAAATLDSVTAIKIISDLGVSGRVVLKNIGSKQYVIFKGAPGQRSIFTGPRYRSSNVKVVDMAIGKIGVNKAILRGARLTIYLVVPLNILNHLLSDNHTMSQLIGETATDVAKVAVSTVFASLAATGAMAFTTLAFGPLVFAIAAGIATMFALEALDRQFGVTDALVKALDNMYRGAGRQLYQVERHLKWQIMNGRPVGRGIFY